MNGPRVVCFGCSKPTTLLKPICDECMRAAGQEPTPYCALCERGFAMTHGMHWNKDGGYIGKCAAVFDSALTSCPQSEKP